MIASSLSTDSEFLERFRDPSVEWVPLPVLPSMHVAKVLLSANRAKIRGVLQRWLQEDTVRWRSHKILLSRPRFAAFWNRVEPVLRTVAATEPVPHKMPVRDLELLVSYDLSFARRLDSENILFFRALHEFSYYLSLYCRSYSAVRSNASGEWLHCSFSNWGSCRDYYYRYD